MSDGHSSETASIGYFRPLLAVFFLHILVVIGWGGQEYTTYPVGLTWFLEFLGLLSWLVIPYYLRKDGRILRERIGWPSRLRVWYVGPAVIPIVSILIVPIYLVNRSRVRSGLRPLIGKHAFSAAKTNPRRALFILYRGVGVAVSLFMLMFLILYLPVSVLLPEDNLVVVFYTQFVIILCVSLFVFRSSVSQERKRHIDILLRDLTVRISAPIGLSMMLLTLSLLIFVLAVILVVPMAFLKPELALAVYKSLFFGIFILPVSVVFVLGLRALPWLNALPVAAGRIFSEFKEMFGPRVRPLASESEEDESENGRRPFIPKSGYDYTDVQLNSKVDFQGYYGYIPTPLNALRIEQVPSSRRRALRLFLIPYAYFVVIFTYIQIRPEHSAELAAMLPAEKILVSGTSFLGLPRVVITQVIALAGLPAETISLGFLGLIVPAILAIPAAWHIALEYEQTQYRLLQRLGGEHHILLWLMQFVMPLILGILWISDRRSRSS